MCGEALRDARRAGALCLVAHEIGLQSPQDQERGVRVERATQGAEIGTHGADQLGARDDGPAHDIAGAGGVLGQAVNEHVHIVVAVLVEAGKGVVHDGERARRMARRVERADVGDLGDRVGRALEEHQARGLRRECAFHAARSSTESMVCVTPNRPSRRRIR